MNAHIMLSIMLLLMLCSCGTHRIDEKYAASVVKDALSIQGNVTVQALKGGFSGAPLFTATTDSKKYVVRFLTKESPEERKQEIATLQIASRCGYGPYVYFADVEKAVVIMEFLHHQNISPQQRQSKELYVLLAKLLQKIHRGPKFENIQDRNVFDTIHKIIQDLKPKCSEAVPLAKLEGIMTAIHQVLAPYVSLAPCHNDLNPNNLIFLGDMFKAIDYENASQDDPYFDIATIANFYCFNNTAHEHILLSTYLDREPSEKEVAKLYLMKQATWILYALIFLRMVPELLYKYEKLQVPSLNDFFKEMSEGKINLEKQEDRLKFAKVKINYIVAAAESQEFRDAISVLGK